MNIAVFASGKGSNVKAILDKIKTGELVNAKICIIISNNSKAGVFELAEENNIDSIHISSKTNPDPEQYEKTIIDLLKKYNIELILLAGYMKLLPSKIIKHFKGDILNIHPALLPRFGGKGMYGIKVHKAVIETEQKESGVTIHYVNAKYDEGLIIKQTKVPVEDGDTPEMLAARVLKAEHDLYWRVVDSIVNKESSQYSH